MSRPPAGAAAVWRDPDELQRRLAALASLSGGGSDALLAEALLPGDEGWPVHRPPARPRIAAVLVGLVDRVDGPQLLLTTRADHLRDHAGQISFPGGRVEPSDADCAATALREAWEEIGLPAENVRVLGELRTYDTVTGFRIHPVVGWVAPPTSWVVDPLEVADVFEMPLAFVLDVANHRRESKLRDGRMRDYWTLPWNNRQVWGATAGIIVNLVRLLKS